MMVTVSPSFKIFPCASLTTRPSSLPSKSASPVHSWPHSGQTNKSRSSYVYSDRHSGQLGNNLTFLFSLFYNLSSSYLLSYSFQQMANEGQASSLINKNRAILSVTKRMP